jgi:hypothetical protein
MSSTCAPLRGGGDVSAYFPQRPNTRKEDALCDVLNQAVASLLCNDGMPTNGEPVAAAGLCPTQHRVSGHLRQLECTRSIQKRRLSLEAAHVTSFLGIILWKGTFHACLLSGRGDALLATPCNETRYDRSCDDVRESKPPTVALPQGVRKRKGERVTRPGEPRARESCTTRECPSRRASTQGMRGLEAA